MPTTTKIKKDPLNSQISAGERTQLIRLVKMKTTDIIAEIEERYADDMAHIDTEIARRFLGDDQRLAELTQELDAITASASHKAAEVFNRYADLVSPSSRHDHYSRPYFSRVDHRRDEARRALTATIQATRMRARTRALAAQTKLIEELTLGALHSDAAKEFVSRMPSASELREAARLAVTAGDKSES